MTYLDRIRAAGEQAGRDARDRHGQPPEGHPVIQTARAALRTSQQHAAK
jgi:hypothetical protein